jgi:endonuclease/exonuclease/phosphatase family metal-dependent hydrolase
MRSPAPFFLVAFLTFMITSACSHSNESATREPVLRVGTWNLRHGVGMDRVLDLERQAERMSGWGADVIALQEMDVGTRRASSVDQPAALGERLGLHSRFARFMDHDGGRYGLALLSKPIPRRAEVFDLPPGPEEPRSALIAELTHCDQAFLVAVVHFDWLDDDSARFAQATALLRRLESERTLPTLVLGDLNDQPGSRTLRAFEAAGFARCDTGAAGTWEAPNPTQIIDHILVRDGRDRSWRVDSARVVEEPLRSDHRPVLAELRLVPR